MTNIFQSMNEIRQQFARQERKLHLERDMIEAKRLGLIDRGLSPLTRQRITSPWGWWSNFL